jgi:hypothetical protein
VGERFIPDYVFPIETEPTNRHSKRLQAQKNRQSLILSTMKGQKNNLEDKLSAAQMRTLWNSLTEEIVMLKEQEFRKVISSEAFYNNLCVKKCDQFNR